MKALAIIGAVGVMGLLAIASEMVPQDPTTALAGGQTGALVVAAGVLVKIANHVKAFLDCEQARRKAEAEHRIQQAEHWTRLETLLSRALGIQDGAPQGVIAGDITPRVVDVPRTPERNNA